MNVDNNFLAAFPSFLTNDVQIVISKVPLTTELDNSFYFHVKIFSEVVYIPERIYYNEPELFYVAALSPLQKDILNCMFSRHHDGFVREMNIRKIILRCNDNIWMIIYVVRPLGEYVILMKPNGIFQE
jgi:hypothetical protein